MKRLIANADDYGRTAGINIGIIESFRRGIVRSTTMMVNYPAAAEGAALARDNPGLGIGLHVQLTGGPPSLPPERLPSLVDKDGQLPRKPENLGNADAAEVLAEARAQLETFRKLMGREPTHLDSHHHSHRTPAVYEAVVALAHEAGLPVRNATPDMTGKLRGMGLRTPDHFIEAFFDETATVEDLLRILAALPEGTSELMCHPAMVDEELLSSSTYAKPRERELAVLTSQAVKDFCWNEKIQLVSFAEL